MTNDKLNIARGGDTRAIKILTISNKPSTFEALDDAILSLIHI